MQADLDFGFDFRLDNLTSCSTKEIAISPRHNSLDARVTNNLPGPHKLRLPHVSWQRACSVLTIIGEGIMQVGKAV